MLYCSKNLGKFFLNIFNILVFFLKIIYYYISIKANLNLLFITF